ncbi:MAG: AsmA family protein [Magnetococcus sp. MYC-9]
MAKLLKFILFLFLSAVLTILLGLGALLALLDPDEHKAQLARLVEERIGRPLTIQGDLSLSFFPWVGVTLGEAELGNAPGFGPQPFARIRAAQVRVKVSSLLQRRVEMDTLAVQGLRLHLEKSAAGVGNWADLLRPSERSAVTGPALGVTTVAPPVGAAANPLRMDAFTVEGVQIQDAQISWLDGTRQPAREMRFSIIDLTSGPLRQEVAVPVAMRLRLERAGSAPADLELSLRGEVVADLAGRRLSVRPVRLALTAPGDALPGGAWALEGHLALDGQTESLRLEGMQLSVAGVQLEGQLEGQGIASSPRLTGTVAVKPFSLRALLQRGGVRLPEGLDPAASGRDSALLSFVATPERLAVSDLQARLDGSQLRGQFSVENFSRPAWRWDLTLDSLDLDRYRAPAVDGAPAEVAPIAAAAGAEEGGPAREPGSAPSPWERLRTPDLQGRLRVEALTVERLSLQEVDLSLQAREGLWRMKPAQARLYQGRLDLEATLDVRESSPRGELELALEGVQAGPLLRAWRGQEPVSGLTTLRTRLASRGQTAEAIKKDLQGSAQWQVKEGEIQGVDLPGLLRDGDLLLQGRPVEPRVGRPATAFSTLSGSATIRNGVVDNRDLRLLSAALRLQGAGTVDLPADRVAYRFNASVVETLQGKGGRTVSALTGLTIPVQVSGSLAHPTWQLDLQGLMEQEAARKAREKLATRIQEKASEVLKKKGLEKVLPADAGQRLLDALPFR